MPSEYEVRAYKILAFVKKGGNYDTTQGSKLAFHFGLTQFPSLGPSHTLSLVH